MKGILKVLSLLTFIRSYVIAFNIKEKSKFSINLERKHGQDERPEFESWHRREVLRWAMGGLLLPVAGLTLLPPTSNAGEIGAKITETVTTSDLGVSVRTSVVKGAQVMDQIDGQWERLSDRFSLGTERSKREGRPKPKVIPDPLPLDVATAKRILAATDQAFVSVAGISLTVLQEQIEKVAALVKPSFQRSGLFLGDSLDFQNGPQFNFVSYVYFKAYSDLILEKKVKFSSFRPNFGLQVGERLVALLLPDYKRTSYNKDLSPERNRETLLSTALSAVDQLCEVLCSKGLVALTERSTIEEENLADWIDDLADLQFNVALDGDVTLPSQILLQEQGFRLYPTYGRYAIASLLQQEGQNVNIEDYYFDTDYNSDPDLFEVKEVLLNIVLESQE
jgi:hypothetical protein